MPSTLAPRRLMLAATPSARALGALEWVGYIVRGLSTVRYLAAVPRRVQVGGHPVAAAIVVRQSFGLPALHLLILIFLSRFPRPPDHRPPTTPSCRSYSSSLSSSLSSPPLRSPRVPH